MKKIMFAALVAAFGIGIIGCQTRITATKNAEVVNPIYGVVKVNGEDKVIVIGYCVTSGGWEATAREPLYSDRALEGLEINVSTNGTVFMKLAKYKSDLSTNAVAMVDGMFKNGANLVTAIGEAYVKIAGGGAQAETVLSTAAKAYDFFVTNGGDPAKATVSADEAAKKITITDGATCIECSDTGICTECSKPV